MDADLALERADLAWVQDWVQVAGRAGTDLGRKLRRVNESADGYEPGGRRFESCKAHYPHSVRALPLAVFSHAASRSRSPQAVQDSAPLDVARVPVRIP